VSRSHRIILALLFATLSLLGWYSIARQTESAELNASNLAKIANAVDAKPGASIDAVVDKLLDRIKKAQPSATPPQSQAAAILRPTASLTVTRQEVFDMTPTDVSTRLWYKKVGAGTAYAPAAFSVVRVTDNPLTADAQKALVKELERRAAQFLPPTKSQISTDQEYFIPLVKVASSDYQSILQSKKHLYVFSILTSHDDALPPKEWWENEYVSDQSGQNVEFSQKTHRHVSTR